MLVRQANQKLLPPPRGNTAARTPIHYGASGEQFFVFNDLCDICNLDMRNCGFFSNLLG